MNIVLPKIRESLLARRSTAGPNKVCAEQGASEFRPWDLLKSSAILAVYKCSGDWTRLELTSTSL